MTPISDAVLWVNQETREVMVTSREWGTPKDGGDEVPHEMWSRRLRTPSLSTTRALYHDRRVGPRGNEGRGNHGDGCGKRCSIAAPPADAKDEFIYSI
jgi:hypothetical protein